MDLTRRRGPRRGQLVLVLDGVELAELGVEVDQHDDVVVAVLVGRADREGVDPQRAALARGLDVPHDGLDKDGSGQAVLLAVPARGNVVLD